MIFRVVHGFAFGAVTVSGNTVVIDIMPSSRRGEGIGYYGLANNIAMSVGPMVGLFMHESCSFETIFLCSLASCALGFAMACLVRTPAKEPVKREPVSARPVYPAQRATGRSGFAVAFDPLRNDHDVRGDVCRGDRDYVESRDLLYADGRGDGDFEGSFRDARSIKGA